MLLKNKLVRSIVTTVAIPFLVSSTFAQSQNPGWVDSLNLQLLVDYECEVIEYEMLHEGKLGGRNTYTAKAVCKDGRKYDANRIGEEQDFVVRICEIVRC